MACAMARAQTTVATGISVDANGVLTAPTNFFSANSNQLVTIFGSTVSGVTTGQLNGASNSILGTVAGGYLSVASGGTITNLVLTNGLNITNWVLGSYATTANLNAASNSIIASAGSGGGSGSAVSGTFGSLVVTNGATFNGVVTATAGNLNYGNAFGAVDNPVILRTGTLVVTNNSTLQGNLSVTGPTSLVGALSGGTESFTSATVGTDNAATANVGTLNLTNNLFFPSLANKVVYLGSGGQLIDSGVTPSSLANVNGLTSGAQTQINAKWTQPFQITASGTNITVGAGVIYFDDGSTISFPGGTIGAFATNTDYIVINYGTTNLHCLRDYVAGDGELLVGIVTMGASSPTSIVMPNTYRPTPSRIGGFQQMQKSGTGYPTVIVAGDSTVQAPRDTGPIFWNMLFNTTYASSNYNVSMAANVNLLNFAIGGTSPNYQLAQFSYLNSPPVANSVWGWQGYGWTGGNADAYPQNNTVYAGESLAYGFQPDLVLMGSGINGGNIGYNGVALENFCRELTQFRSIPTILITQHDLMTAGSNTPPSYYSEFFQTGWAKALRQGLPLAVAHTWAYVDEGNMRGIQTTYDGTHQNNYAQTLWAEAILGVIANRQTQVAPISPPSGRIILPPTVAEYPRLPFGSHFVVKPAATSGTVAQITTSSMYAGTSNTIPFLWGYPNGGIGATTTGYQISSGGIATYVSEAWTGARVFLERTGAGVSSGTFSYLDVGASSNNLGTWTYNDSSAGDFPGELFEPYTITPTQIAAGFTTNLIAARNGSNGVVVANLGLVGNGGLAIAVTNGVPLKVLGVLFYGPHKTNIPLSTNNTDALTLTGTWANGPDPFLYPQVLSSDEKGSTLRLKFKGNGAYFNVRCSPAGGTITVWLDGAVYNSYNLYSSGRPPMNIYVWPTVATKDLTRGYGNHEVLIQYNGPSATGTTQPPSRFATGTPVISGGAITSVGSVVGGQGYGQSGLSPGVVVYGGGGGSSAQLLGNLSGSYPSTIASFSVSSGGSGYTNVPSIYVEGGLHGLTITKITTFSP